MFGGQFENKRVWLSGHTGFKGSWLAAWLHELGARVHGFALAPATNPSVFEQLGLASRLDHELGDIRDLEAVRASIKKANPDYVFHLAAQPLVRLSYAEPLQTYQTNVMGTVHVLEALRDLNRPCPAVFVTTDKCYLNLEKDYAYHEEDSLGGRDPYSSSKAAAEIVIAAYRHSFFEKGGSGGIKISSARAGNVIGGGDWAIDRIVPDAVRALAADQAVRVRNKRATRPWQHVLEPLSGYLWLAAVLQSPSLRSTESESALASAFNFGPNRDSNRTVEQLMEEVLKHWPGTWLDEPDPAGPHEATLLNLATDKAKRLLAWEPVWNFEQSVAATIAWYRQSAKESDALAVTRGDIQTYQDGARQRGLAWAQDRE